jgi:hypothetical protein
MSISATNRTKYYVWQLASFLYERKMVMSGEELAAHLNRNSFLTSYGDKYAGGRGTYTLIRETWNWVNNDLGLESEAEKVARAYVKQDGTYAYEE